mmetsp:Transcript_27224/g.56720  ORF Transcript_27224/g.56720 Transcript_27224/m.56720 type:complete len:261 (+) Transcript_27224:220-1002(+)
MNEPQVAFLCLYLLYITIILLYQHTLLLYPFRLLTTFLHELSHAIACWITCGDVRSIRVFENEGGVTSYVGGCRVLIIPAGYVGAALWGSVFVMFSGGRKTATGAAGLLVAMLLLSLCYAPNRTMVYLNLCYAVVTSVCIYLEWKVFTPLLNFVVLFYGAFVGVHAIYDTYSDTIRRSILQSDAYACYEICPCCLPRCVGVQWAILNVVLQVLAVWIAMVQLSEECEDAGWWECMNGVVGGNDLWDVDGVKHTLEGWIHW